MTGKEAMISSDGNVERVATAIASEWWTIIAGELHPDFWISQLQEQKDQWRQVARAALAALPRAEPDGERQMTDNNLERDLFACFAMQGMLAHSTRYRPREGAPANWHEALAEEAYQIADAMLAQRANMEKNK